MATLNPAFKKLSDEGRTRSLIMGVLNVTPDSFSDGGQYLDPPRAVARALAMIAEGADILDLGGESTRPGATPVSVDEELRRVIPVAEAISNAIPKLVWSIDTTKAKVAEAALKLGACMVNDVSALQQDETMAALVARTGCGAVLMHRGPAIELRKYLMNRASSLLMEGLSKQQFWIDPGFGFGKSVEENLGVLRGLPELIETGYPVLLGTSRKSTLGALLGGVPESDRLEATLTTVALAAFQGVACLRVHDVKECARAAKVARAIKGSGPAPEARVIHPFRSSEEF